MKKTNQGEQMMANETENVIPFTGGVLKQRGRAKGKKATGEELERLQKHARENLTQLPKGVSGNPSGRPVDYLTKAIRRKLDPETADSIATMLIERALKGDLRTIAFITDRAEGRAIGRQEVGKPGDFDKKLDEIPEDALETIVATARKLKAVVNE